MRLINPIEITIPIARARRTIRLSRAHREIGLALGGAPGGRLASRIGMRISGATLLRSVRAASVRASSPPTIIGVDDCAVRKRQRYGTIIVDTNRLLKKSLARAAKM